MSVKLTRLHTEKSLHAFVKGSWLLEGEFENGEFLRILPFGAVDIIVHKHSPMEYASGNEQKMEPKVFIEGQYLRPFYKKPSKYCQFLGVTLQPWTTKSLFNLPSSELTGQLVDLQAIDSVLSDQLEAIVSDQLSHSELENSLNELLSAKCEGMELDKRTTDLVGISQLDENSYRSEWEQTSRSFQIRFKELFGITWSQLRNKKRFMKSINYLNEKSVSQMDVAHLSGYYDQAHFIRHFNQFTGMTPSKYLKSNDVLTALTELCKPSHSD